MGYEKAGEGTKIPKGKIGVKNIINRKQGPKK